MNQKSSKWLICGLSASLWHGAAWAQTAEVPQSVTQPAIAQDATPQVAHAEELQPAENAVPELAPVGEEDVRVQTLLRQADRVKLTIEWLGMDEAGWGVMVTKDVAEVAPIFFVSAVDKIRLRPYKSNGFGTSVNPVLYFNFFKGTLELGALSLGYNYKAAEHWLLPLPKYQNYRNRNPNPEAALDPHRNNRNLNPEAAVELRLWVSTRPQLQKILLRLGASREALRPDLRQQDKESVVSPQPAPLTR